MGYYASYDGYITFKEYPSKEIQEYINRAFNEIEIDNFNYTFYGYEKYYEDEIYDLFEQIENITSCGEIEYKGEDGCLWRFIFKDGKWNEESGKVIYESNEPPIKTNDDRLEFLGEIIDVFEDFLEEKGVFWENDEREEESAALFYGTEYGNIEDQLERLMKRWKILK